MKASKVIIAICIVLALFAVFIFFERQDQSPQTRQLTQDNPVEQALAMSQSAQHPSESDNVVSSQPSGVNEPSKATPWNSPAGYEHVTKWRESRGYLSDEDLQIYENYSIETIKELASTGDVKAIQVLARIYVREGKPELVISTLREAAIRGSSESLILEGMMTQPASHLPQFNGPDGVDRYKKIMLESLSIFKAASLRGDRAVDERITETRSQLTLTPDDERYIEQRGTEIYNEMEEKRKTLGLGPFDNSIPPQVKDYFDAAEKGFLVN